jgi:glutamate synthase (ferredoxin)
MSRAGYPPKQGLYDPSFEHDACGVGFIVDMKGRKSHTIVKDALQILLNLAHRGACGCEPNTGDGAGILLQTPHAFFQQETAKLGVSLPGPGEFAVGQLFLPRDAKSRKAMERIVDEVIEREGQRVLGWRTVPTDNSPIGASARTSEPCMRQVFVGRNAKLDDDMAFERKLYVIRQSFEQAIKASSIPGRDEFYVPSFSSKTILYKGMLISDQLPLYYPDLVDPAMESALALVHSRFSTNTFPSWSRAHPYRYVCHNGEINTLRGNINWMRARQMIFESELFGEDIDKIRPIIDADGSDSGMFDNALEMLVLTGRSLPHAVMMMIPEPWSSHESMSDEKKAFYEYHSCLMEPWDGPASIAFTDGTRIGAVLDRNGLRPSRYYITKDDVVIMASEVGVLDVAPERVLQKGRLQPGRMFLVDMEEGRVVADEEVKHEIATAEPYRRWLQDHLVRLEDLPDAPHDSEVDLATVLLRQQAFGYTLEDLRFLMQPMAKSGVEALGSMGTDTPLAVLSEKPQLLYNYFKQLFAQVTNPPVDAIREEIVMSTEVTLGSEGNLLKPEPSSCRHIKLKRPVLKNEELEKIRHMDRPGFKVKTLPILFEAAQGGVGLERAMEHLSSEASKAIAEGVNILILSDRGIDRKLAAIPALLAVAGLHHHLIREGTRTLASIILESAEPREVHHFALCIGYGVTAINPYLAFESLASMMRQNMITGEYAQAVENYVKGVVKGIIKVISKMGISTIQSYRGGQIFEAIGLNQELIDKYFTWTASRVEGIGIDQVAQEIKVRHERAFPDRQVNGKMLDVGGNYQWRRDGEYHLFNPETVHKLQKACRTNDYEVFKKYSGLVDNQSQVCATLRGLCEFEFAEKPVPLDEVESVETIVKRFKTGAMSYGSISREAHESLAIAMNRLGGKSNTGEGGEDPDRYERDSNGDSRSSSIKQVASGRFGVTSQYLVNSTELQIKIAQGAKPGEGGQLPGHKVYPWIAKVRNSTPGVGLISPPPHHDIYSIEDLSQLIHDLKNANDKARISVKLVSEVGVGTVAAGVAKAHADVVLISGFDGGTGASPLTSVKHAGAPWELGLAETHQTLLLNNLRSRIVVEVDGQLKTGRDVVIGALLGAEEFGFATAPLVALGCIMMRVCHVNTCPVGVATQDPRLREKFTGDPAHVVNFMNFVAQEVRELMARLGFRTIDEMVGRVDKLKVRKAVDHWKARGLDYSQILYQPEVSDDVGRYCQMSQDHGLRHSLDKRVLFDLCKPAIERGEKVTAELPIQNTNRVVGTLVGSEITRRHGPDGLPEDTVRLHFRGSAGLSFGAFMPRGLTLTLEGDSNDYIGKGLSGGKIIVYPPDNATFVPEENIIVGNVALYGASGGEVYIRGMAGERFCVRNSGAHTVVEAVGDHGCEYMTGGRVVVLGPTGRNFAAGMSGGIAYIFDEKGDFSTRCNTQMVRLESLADESEVEEVRSMIRRHAEYTKSQRAWQVLALWDQVVAKFVKVMPKDYKRVLETLERIKSKGMSGDEAIMAAFEENSRDVARIGGS